jgi:hypothetical protein
VLPVIVETVAGLPTRALPVVVIIEPVLLIIYALRLVPLASTNQVPVPAVLVQTFFHCPEVRLVNVGLDVNDNADRALALCAVPSALKTTDSNKSAPRVSAIALDLFIDNKRLTPSLGELLIPI